MTQITENFSYSEFLESSTADRLGYELLADRWTREQIERLVMTCLQPIREQLDVPIVITSGYRPPWLNRIIKGSKGSRHMYGCAADFKTPTIAHAEAFETIRAMQLPIDQMIIEPSWLHLGVELPGQLPRKQYMMATRGMDGSMYYENV